jgi:hypothetical protein
MTLVTVQVLEGLERGRVFADLTTPVTIGREDDNAVRLNDERVSRFHAKIQSDGDQLILTDLDSTNGTRVNGHPVQMHVLRPGDQLNIGRCLLLFGDAEEIQGGQASDGIEDHHTLAAPSSGIHANLEDIEDDFPDLFPNGPPDVPEELDTLQRAQLADLLAYVHEQIGHTLRAGISNTEDSLVTSVDDAAWQRLLALEMKLAVDLSSITDPDR